MGRIARIGRASRLCWDLQPHPLGTLTLRCLIAAAFGLYLVPSRTQSGNTELLQQTLTRRHSNALRLSNQHFLVMTSTQIKLASILPHATGLLSIIGNSAIILDIARRYRSKTAPPNVHHQRPGTYHRLMLGMSVTNMSAAVCSGLSTWPMPRGSAPYQAFGTDGTCTAQAFFLQIGIGAPFYNLALAAYYYMFICRNATSRRIALVERFMHLVCLGYGFGTAAAGLAMGIYGPASFWCWVERGADGENEVWRWIFWHGPLWVIIVVVSMIMAVIYRTLRKQERRQTGWSSRRMAPGQQVTGQTGGWRGRRTIPGSFLFVRPSFLTTEAAGAAVSGGGANDEGSDQEPGNDDDDGADDYADDADADGPPEAPPPPQDSNRQPAAKMNRATSSNFSASESFKWQSLWYLGCFYLTWIFLTATRAMQAAKRPVPFWLVLLAVTFSPALGWFNCLVYFRPRCIQHRKLHPEAGRIATFFIVVFHCNSSRMPPSVHRKQRGRSNRETDKRNHENEMMSSPNSDGPSNDVEMARQKHRHPS